MQNTPIEVDGLHKAYDGQPVLRDPGVSFVSVLWCRAAGGW
jgi:hypothetical protein